MKFSEIWTKVIAPVGSMVGDFVPYVGPAVKAINSFMPDDKKLPENASKDEIQAAVDSLPPEQKAALMEKKIELEIVKEKEWSKVVDSLAKADATGNTTRHDIAMMFARAVVFIDGLMSLLLAWAVYKEQIDIVTAWPMVVAITGPPLTVIMTYFGKRTVEKLGRYAQSTGRQHVPGIAGMIGSLLKR